MTLTKKLTKIGNSWGIILPSQILKAVGINAQSKVDISWEENRVILTPSNSREHRVLKTFKSILRDYDTTLDKLAKMNKEQMARLLDKEN